MRVSTAHARCCAPRVILWSVKRNLTVQLDEGTIRKAKVVAAERGTSLSGLVARQIEELVAAHERYQRAHESAVRMMRAAQNRGGRTWTREDLYAQRLDRFDS